MLRRFRGALLADPVGSGKSYIALAVACAWRPHVPPAVVAPAALIPQWDRLARRLEISAHLWSHERLSRGRLPPGSPSLVIVDESHRFRNQATLRYRTFAPWLVGRTVLLLSATPVVNRLADLSAQLLLGVRDDALATEGVSSLRKLLEGGGDHPALGALILQRPREVAIPGRRERAVLVPEDDWLRKALPHLDRLRISRSPGLGRLVRGVFWRAAASSPAALRGALSRYRLLLRHCQDAGRGTRPAARSWVRRFIDQDPSQLVLWPLMGTSVESADLTLDDLPLLDLLLSTLPREPRSCDAKAALLADLLKENQPTLIFTTARETVHYLRQRISSSRLAWCTGAASGIGRLRATRESVLAWFRPSASLPHTLGPTMLLTTDVSAEGLDLQRAGRVVHYDLPWTSVRLEQRDGRALRLGSTHSSVEVITFRPPAPLEQRLRQDQLLVVKRGLPARAGLGTEGRRCWRWRDELAGRWPGVEPGTPPVAAVVEGEYEGLLLGFRILRPGGPSCGTLAAYLGLAGTWSEDPDLIEHWLECAIQTPGRPLTAREHDATMEIIAPFIRARLGQLRYRSWHPRTYGLEARRMLRRLQQLARKAARHRDIPMLELAERGIAFARRGHTAGEGMLLAGLASASICELRVRLRNLAPDALPRAAPYPVLCAALVFQTPPTRPNQGALSVGGPVSLMMPT